MIDIPEYIVDAWLRYYYAANSVGYIVRHAKADAYARSLSRLNPEDIVNELKVALERKPETPSDVIRPYLFAMAAAHNGKILKSDVLSIDAQYTKWFSDYVSSIFRSPSHTSSLMSSGNTKLILPGNFSLGRKQMTSSVSSIFVGAKK